MTDTLAVQLTATCATAGLVSSNSLLRVAVRAFREGRIDKARAAVEEALKCGEQATDEMEKLIEGSSRIAVMNSGAAFRDAAE